MTSNFAFLLQSIIILLVTTISLSAQISYLEIKNHRVQTATYGQIDLSKKRGIKKHTKFQINLPDIDTLATNKIAKSFLDSIPTDDTLDILIYIHAMWGGADFFIMKKISPKPTK